MTVEEPRTEHPEEELCQVKEEATDEKEVSDWHANDSDHLEVSG
jgi:hypothetical protein